MSILGAFVFHKHILFFKVIISLDCVEKGLPCATRQQKFNPSPYHNFDVAQVMNLWFDRVKNIVGISKKCW